MSDEEQKPAQPQVPTLPYGVRIVPVLGCLTTIAVGKNEQNVMFVYTTQVGIEIDGQVFVIPFATTAPIPPEAARTTARALYEAADDADPKGAAS